MSVLLVKQQISVLSHPFWGVTYAIHLQFIGKLIVDFLQVIIKHFSLVRRTEALIRRNLLLLKGVVTLELNIRLKGYVHRQHLVYTVG